VFTVLSAGSVRGISNSKRPPLPSPLLQEERAKTRRTPVHGFKERDAATKMALLRSFQRGDPDSEGTGNLRAGNPPSCPEWA
jgi:hypothetical protein